MIALIIIWLLTTTAFAVMLFDGVRDTGQFYVARHIIHAAYVLILFWYLSRIPSSSNQLPDLRPLLFPNRRIGRMIPVVVLALLLWSEFSGKSIVLPLLIIAAIWVLIVWRREVGLHAVLIGVAIAAAAGLAGLPFYQNQYIGKVQYILFLIFVIPMFVAGGLLSKRTGFVGSHLFTRRYKKAAVGFLWGCLLFIPLGLANAAAGSPGPWMTWVDHWWIPWTQPWFSGIVEETWWRLFLVSLCYFLLRPAFNKIPTVAFLCAALFSAITFGLGHGGTLQERFLITGLLYGLPMALIFIRRDWEHAVGAHYMINMIPTLMAFLEI